MTLTGWMLYSVAINVLAGAAWLLELGFARLHVPTAAGGGRREDPVRATSRDC
jgi:hypothetical protein